MLVAYVSFSNYVHLPIVSAQIEHTCLSTQLVVATHCAVIVLEMYLFDDLAVSELLHLDFRQVMNALFALFERLVTILYLGM